MYISFDGFNFDCGWVDVTIPEIRIVTIEMSMITIPLLNEVEELVLEGSHGGVIQLLTIDEVEVEADFEFEGFLIHQIIV